ncbi:S-layer protein domain-containing protein [Methanimicrococcus blatticola]|uniref:S-layer protein (TIGR01567 family) n=1 Tax=Methanimicrococcus blatticola TaxID=91560 RepID=A0A484F2I5_9EURY|nr:S-layer protein domain-containing protein [Methanimicrococcus blatticola]MBZ3936342.1 hypothetical protein [Methanimicrococcus blatticola]MCC2509505.1 hypothetical protein [Methanimicrococcus blatticola]TDQ67556.1 S-layer protein (TIGR01567 family) [Methanimicrococcus blatticola]
MIKKMKYLSFLVLLGLIIAALAVPVSAAAIKGSNVWDQEQSMSSTYTWTPAIYSGLWYDLDRGIYTENITLTISASDRQINADNAEYVTEYKNMRFAYADWGSYRVIGWQGEPYFAGYTRSNSGNMSTTQFTNNNISTLSDEKIYPVLLDNDNEKSLSSGDTYTLENGYKLKISDVNESSKQFRLTLEKSGSSVKNETVSNNTTFVYERSLDDVGTVPIIAVHVKNINGTKVVIDGIFQISESATDVNEGKKVGAMEIKTVNETRITMKNPDRIKLNADSTVTLMGHIKIDVKDASKLKFELVSNPKTDDEKTYSDRGMVYDSSNKNKSWNGMNFPGFTYDYNNSTETENLSFDVSGTLQRSVSAKQILYSTNAYNESFNYSDWGSYQAINLGGENYFAGYLRYNSSNKNNTTNFTDSNDSILKDGDVSKVLINNGTEKQYNKGANISLEEGYSLQISNITDNGSKVNLVLKKDGSTVKEEKIKAGENFVYETSVGDTTIPVIAVRVTNVFEGSSAVVKIGGIFQISTKTTDVGKGTSLGNMNVEYTSSTALIFVNKDSINLSRGSNITLMENLSLHVADSDDLRLFPFSKSSGNNSSTVTNLRIEVPETIYPNEEIIIKVVYNNSSSWKELAGAIVKVNNTTIGETNSSGAISYKLGNAGSYEFRAEKSGYSSVTLTKSTSEGGDELQIVIPDYIFSEDSFRLYVKDENNTNVTGAGVYKNGEHIGTTNDNGMINVTADSTPGLAKLTANKTGYMTGTKEMEVLPYGPYFAVTNITLPEESMVNKTVKIAMTIENVGKEKDTQEVVIVAENKTETKKVTLSPGETKNLTFSFKPKTAGESSIEVTNQTFTFTATEKPKVEIPWKLILLGGGFLIIIIGAVLALMYYKEREEEEKQNPRSGRGNDPESRSIYEKIEGLFGGNPDQKEKTGGKKSSASAPEKSAGKPKSSTAAQSAAATKSKASQKYSSSNKPPELKNSQKRARKEQEKK